MIRQEKLKNSNPPIFRVFYLTMDESLSEHATLMSEFAAWRIKNPERIDCGGQSLTEDGRLVLELSINDTKFRLLCPTNYPEHEDSFFMETECTDFWCIALNEFIIDYPRKLTLDVILAKAFLYYTPSSEKSCASSENESTDNEYDSVSSSEDSDSSETEEWEYLISRKKREWREKEGELRLRYNRPKISDMFDGKIMDHPQQVFSNSAASAILINDLINIMGSKESCGIVVDPVDNDVCRWSVFLNEFQPESRIYKDLEETEELYGYDHVQLQLDFAMDLYPSHPPLIKIVRPKLLNVFDTEEFVKLANWNPARDMLSVLKEIKDYINRSGRIDVKNKFNGVKVGVVRKVLSKLADVLENERKSTLRNSEESRYFQKCLTGFKDSPPWREKNATVEILGRLLSCLKNTECEENSPTKSAALETNETDSYFTFNLTLNNNFFDERSYEVRFSEASSYSSSTFKAFDRLMEHRESETQNRYANEQKSDTQSDKKHCNIITNPSFELGSKSQDQTNLRHQKYSVNEVSLDKTNGASSCGDKNSKNNFDGSKRRNETNIKRVNDTVVSSFNANVKTLKEYSTTTLNNSSPGLNANLSCVFKTLEESVLLPFIRSKLVVDTFFGMWLTTSLYSKIIEIIFELSSNPHLINLLATFDAHDQSIADLIKIHGDNMTLILKKLTDVADERPMKQVDLDKAELARSVIDVSKLIESQLTKHSNEVFSVSNNHVKSLDSIYKDSLKDLRFSNCEIDLETHTFKHNYIADVDSPRNYFRLAQEFAFLSKFLPIEKSSSIFVVTDNSKSSLMRALITGADGTCCSGGCFSFDIYLKKDYPYDGLEINCTTFSDGENTPQLNDRVALSLGEDLSSPVSTSTILQVLTSIEIEKLIPLEACTENRKIISESKEILLENVIRFGMINQMRKPTAGFEEAIATHFRIKKDRILSELERYDFLKNSQLLTSLKKEFDRLTRSSQKI